MLWNAQAHGVPDDTLWSTADVRVVESDDMTVFMTTAAAGRAGLVFLPGGGIQPKAYVPQLRSVAAAGFPVALVYLPYRLALTDAAREVVWQRIQLVRQLWGESRPVVLGGHSRGAATAVWLAARHGGELTGLALVGTTHPRDDDLSALPIPVLKVLAEHDCVAPPADARANAARLPATTRWVEIPGGNHAQFGHYGAQLTDCRATISRENQQRAVTEALAAELERASTAR